MRSASVPTTLLCLAVALPGGNVLAQQRQQVSFTVPDQNIKFIVSQNVEVGDVPNHIVRLFDTRETLPNKAVTINGLEITEILGRGTAELTDGLGGGTAFLVFVAANGDKFFSRNRAQAQRASGKLSATWVGTITGGTGRFAGIQGTLRRVNNFDPSPGGVIGGPQYEIEYSIGK